jgi:hypothetical protein
VNDLAIKYMHSSMKDLRFLFKKQTTTTTTKKRCSSAGLLSQQQLGSRDRRVMSSRTA